MVVVNKLARDNQNKVLNTNNYTVNIMKILLMAMIFVTFASALLFVFNIPPNDEMIG